MEMGVLDGRHLNVRILIDDAGSRVATEEHLGNRNGAGAVAYSDVRAYRQVVHQSLDRRRGTGRAVNRDGVCALEVVFGRKQAPQASGMVAMRMSNEDGVDVSNGEAGAYEAARHTFT